MKFLMRVIKRLLAFLRLYKPKLPPETITFDDSRELFIQGKYSYQNVKDYPDKLLPNVVYLQGKPGQEWLAGFLCPCGCGDTIELTLMKTFSPRWSIVKHEKGEITLKPSINRTTNCCSHFFITEGIIEWC